MLLVVFSHRTSITESDVRQARLPGPSLKAESIQLAEIEILKIRFLPGQWQEPAISASQC